MKKKAREYVMSGMKFVTDLLVGYIYDFHPRRTVQKPVKNEDNGGKERR